MHDNVHYEVFDCPYYELGRQSNWLGRRLQAEFGATRIWCVVAFNSRSGHIVGYHQFVWNAVLRVYDDDGALVARRYRKQGIAKKMWTIGLTYFEPSLVKVQVITENGARLIGSVRRQFPKLSWRVFREETDKVWSGRYAREARF